MGNGSNSTPQTAPAAKAAPQPGGSLPPPIEAGSRPGPRRGAKRLRPSLVLPPPRPFHRQSRPAASRIAGITNRREQPTGDLRLPSFVPGKLQEGTGVPSWFPPSAERSWIIFRRGVYVAKNTSQAASVENGRPNGAAILCAQSACAFIRPRQLCCLGRGNLSLKCSSVHFSETSFTFSPGLPRR